MTPYLYGQYYYKQNIVETHNYLAINKYNNNSVPIQESEQSCIFVLRISFFPLSTIFVLDFGTVTEDGNWNEHDCTKCHIASVFSIETSLS